ncbi:hypothetical protein [Sphaerisporangium aureirubrum]|uniref:Uncharacterized protein n=1 Tax=Sphaerisporangium aureirubrum TaxID=1544736 RepID=A0ABW1NE41_9ACTN
MNPPAETVPGLPEVTLMRCPRTGDHYLIAIAARCTPTALIDLGEHLAATGRRELAQTPA